MWYINDWRKQNAIAQGNAIYFSIFHQIILLASHLSRTSCNKMQGLNFFKLFLEWIVKSDWGNKMSIQRIIFFLIFKKFEIFLWVLCNVEILAFSRKQDVVLNYFVLNPYYDAILDSLGSCYPLYLYGSLIARYSV